MSAMPAVCDNCGSIFSSGFAFENAKNVSLSSNKSQCPNCGYMGHVPDGVYNFVGNSIELLQGPQSTISDLERLRDILAKAKSRNLSVGEIKNEVNSEVSQFRSLADLLPHNRSDLYAFIQIVISIIGIMITLAGSGKTEKININEVINNPVFNQIYINTKSNSSSSESANLQKESTKRK